MQNTERRLVMFAKPGSASRGTQTRNQPFVSSVRLKPSNLRPYFRISIHSRSRETYYNQLSYHLQCYDLLYLPRPISSTDEPSVTVRYVFEQQEPTSVNRDVGRKPVVGRIHNNMQMLSVVNLKAPGVCITFIFALNLPRDSGNTSSST